MSGFFNQQQPEQRSLKSDDTFDFLSELANLKEKTPRADDYRNYYEESDNYDNVDESKEQQLVGNYLQNLLGRSNYRGYGDDDIDVENSDFEHAVGMEQIQNTKAPSAGGLVQPSAQEVALKNASNMDFVMIGKFSTLHKQ